MVESAKKIGFFSNLEDFPERKWQIQKNKEKYAKNNYLEVCQKLPT
jgi:uncharacterized protein YwgA